MKRRDVLAIFNRGVVSRHALARTDVDRVALSAEQQVNWLPKTLGSMSLRPGTTYIGNADDNTDALLIPFVFGVNDASLIELTPDALRVWEGGDTLTQRVSVTASIANGSFVSDLTGWTDADDSGGESTWRVGGFMGLLGTGYTAARRRQEIAIGVGEHDVKHALRIVVSQGACLLRIGTTAGADDVFNQAVLRAGTHSIAFTPGAAAVHLELSSSSTSSVLVESVAMETAGAMSLPTPWGADIAAVRWQQVGDVVFCACERHRPQRIERRVNGSWSVVEYAPTDGPFLADNLEPIRITASSVSGDITLTASAGIFYAGHVGALFRLTSQGQFVTGSFSSDASFTDAIRVTGVGEGRVFEVTRLGSWVGTISLQRSIGDEGNWVTVASYTSNGTVNYDDGLDNVVVYYRIGIASGDYNSGTATGRLNYSVGSVTGFVRVTGITSETEASAVVLRNLGAFGSGSPFEIWAEGAWSSHQKWPSAVALYEGRLWWAGKSRIWGSISDALDSFDADFEGDAGPINRSLGDGAVDTVSWLLPAQRLIAGAGSAELSIRSTSFDEPLTPTNFNVKPASTQGSAAIPPVLVDGRGVFVQRSRRRIYEAAYDIQRQDYSTLDLTALTPELAMKATTEVEQGFSRLAVQRQPETRVWAVMRDGRAAVLIRDPAEDVLGWSPIETSGDIIDVAVLPGAVEDRVFWLVRRLSQGVPFMALEEMARDDECRGGSLSKLADCGKAYSGTSRTTLDGLSYLEGRQVVVWADGRDLGSYTVSGGEITLSEPGANVWVGLKYEAEYKSAKLAGATGLGSVLSQRQRIDHVGLILADTHAQGLRYGPALDRLDSLPFIENGTTVDGDAVWEAYAEDMVEFDGEWSTDARLCLNASAPRPCTVLAAVLSVSAQDKA